MSHEVACLARRVFLSLGVLLLVGVFTGAGFADDAPKPVVIYTAHDRQFSEPILLEYTRRTGVEVRPVYDTEAVKTVGLVNRLLAERQSPRCDVFWNNELLRSVQLMEEGLTAAYHSPSAATIPDAMKDPDGHWTGFAARARVILVNTKKLGDRPAPTSPMALIDPAWKGEGAFAKPLFGTTSSHAAVIWAMRGADYSKDFWTRAVDNGLMMPGNAQARDAVVDGRATFCWTDTDDAYGAIEDGAPVKMYYPEEDPAGPGTLLIPNTVVLIKGSPNPEGGKALIDFLLSEEVEAMLAKSRSAQIPVRESVAPPPGLEPLPKDRILAVDWGKARESIAPCSEWLHSHLALK
ncbi:extracellular solute-binding protein [bacterium]|nr:extracellular solute-binding protein [bacterium]